MSVWPSTHVAHNRRLSVQGKVTFGSSDSDICVHIHDQVMSGNEENVSVYVCEYGRKESSQGKPGLKYHCSRHNRC